MRNADWPRESLEDVFYIPADLPLPEIVKAVTYLAREKKIDRIVALDEFDMETAATLREHMRIPGMGLTTMRYFRDKLAMRMKAMEHGIRVPISSPFSITTTFATTSSHVPGPWVLKPRSEASAIGIKKIDSPEALWPVLESLGDQQSSFLLEKFVPGDVYHVDSVVSEKEVVFSSVSRYGAAADGRGAAGRHLYHLSFARRIGGSHRPAPAQPRTDRRRWDWCAECPTPSSSAPTATDTFIFWNARRGWAAHTFAKWSKLATGINLWREWARIEIAGGKEPYRLPAMRGDYAGMILSLARQEDPDTSAYNDPEIALRLKRRHHAGLVLRSPDPGARSNPAASLHRTFRRGLSRHRASRNQSRRRKTSFKVQI